MKLLVIVTLALASAGRATCQRSLRGSVSVSEPLKRVPLAPEPEQFEATQDDESEQITAKLAAAHAQEHVLPSLQWTPIASTDDAGNLQ